MVSRRPAEPVSAFAPATITNFFAIEYGARREPAGATGGGYILPEGVVSKATVLSRDSPLRIRTVVDGDERFEARTTRRAVGLVLQRGGVERGEFLVDQRMAVPVGCGFGASSAAAISAAYAIAGAVGLHWPKARVALAAYDAEILEGTGLGTVSVAYDYAGAGVITAAGKPGAAEFRPVGVPRGTRLVAASIGPYIKRDALSSSEVRKRIDRLGRLALRGFLRSPDIETMASCGEEFSSRLGLMTEEVSELVRRGKAAGASHVSQNMIGHAVHAIVTESKVSEVARAMSESLSSPRVQVFRLGSRRAGILRGKPSFI